MLVKENYIGVINGVQGRTIERKCIDFPEEKIKNLCDNFFSTQRPLFSLSQKIWNPPTDVYETKDEIIIKMEIAGVRKADIEITAENNRLMVRGNRNDPIHIGKENYHIMEIHYGHFERIFGLPKNLDHTKINAVYKDGFLNVSIPKIKSIPREIVINVSESE